MNDILRDMLIWMFGFLCVSAAALIAARAIANHFQQRAQRKAQAAKPAPSELRLPSADPAGPLAENRVRGIARS